MQFVLKIFIIGLLILSCHSPSVNREKKIAVEIASESCSFISEITSSFIIGAISGVLTENLNMIPGYWCECYTYYISKDLMEKFTLEELRGIKQDNIKKIKVLSKLFQLHQEEIKTCIDLTTQEKIKNYADFERKLNRKLKNQQKESE